MDVDNEIDEDFEKELKCPNCQNNFDHSTYIPHLLPECGHSICSFCI